MNILLIEDHKSFQEGIALFLESNLPSMEHLHLASDGKEGLEKFKANSNIDVVITDLNLPEINGFEVIENIRSISKQTKIIVLTMYYNKSIITKLKKLKIDGFLTKNISLKEIIIAIDKSKNKEVYITPEIFGLFMEHDFGNQDELNSEESFAKSYSLSKREMQVLKLLAQNKSNLEISKDAYVSVETIRSHRKNIYRKLGVNNTLDMYKILISNKIVSN